MLSNLIDFRHYDFWIPDRVGNDHAKRVVLIGEYGESRLCHSRESGNPVPLGVILCWVNLPPLVQLNVNYFKKFAKL